MSLIKNIYLLLLSTTMCHGYTIVLQAVGNTQSAGRAIGDNFEKGIVHQCILEIQSKLSVEFKKTTVFVISDNSADYQPYFTARYCNKVNADLCIILSFFEEATTPCNIHIFYQQIHDQDEKSAENQEQIIPISMSHMHSFKTTQKLAQHLFHYCTHAPWSKTWCAQTPLGLPCTQLTGLSIPALYIEIGIHKSHNYTFVVDPLTEAIATICF